MDPEGGDDARGGTAESMAWKTMERVNTAVFQPGDRILFKRSGSWAGQLQPKGNGAEGAPIQIDSYGSGDLPKISGQGAPYTLCLSNQEYWEIRNLEIRNHAPQEGERVGLLVVGEEGPGVLHHVYLEKLRVCDVKGMLGTGTQARTTGGIGFEIRGYKAKMRYDDVRVQNCEIENTDSCGIYTWTDFRTHPRDPRWDQLKSTGVLVCGNQLKNIGKNAVVVRSAEKPLVEGNRVERAAARIHGNAIYLYGCKEGVMQKNEVSGTQFLEHKEGAALDSDYKSQGTIIQYNFSHENGGGLVNFCSNPSAKEGEGYNDGTIVRYNISQNDVFRVFGFDGPVTRTRIYNNTIYVGAGLAPKIYDIDRFGKAEGYASEVLSQNNIIVNKGKGSYRLEHGTGVLFENNCFYGNHPKDEPADAKKIKADPQFSAAVLNPKPGQVPEYFRLALGSPCAGAGIKIPDNGGRDFWGNPVDSAKPSIGASE